MIGNREITSGKGLSVLRTAVEKGCIAKARKPSEAEQDLLDQGFLRMSMRKDRCVLEPTAIGRDYISLLDRKVAGFDRCSLV